MNEQIHMGTQSAEEEKEDPPLLMVEQPGSFSKDRNIRVDTSIRC